MVCGAGVGTSRAADGGVSVVAGVGIVGAAGSADAAGSVGVGVRSSVGVRASAVVLGARVDATLAIVGAGPCVLGADGRSARKPTTPNTIPPATTAPSSANGGPRRETVCTAGDATANGTDPDTPDGCIAGVNGADDAMGCVGVKGTGAVIVCAIGAGGCIGGAALDPSHCASSAPTACAAST